jgi:hypothetical protein
VLVSTYNRSIFLLLPSNKELLLLPQISVQSEPRVK